MKTISSAVPFWGAILLLAAPPAFSRSLGQEMLEGEVPAAVAGEIYLAPRPDLNSDGALPAPRGLRRDESSLPAVKLGPIEGQRTPAPPGVERIQPLGPTNDALRYLQQADGHWVRGRSFKARAARGGFTYVPFLGSSASRNYPVRFRLESVAIANEHVPLTRGAEVTREGDRFVLDRGFVLATYDIALEQVEQSFIIDRPAASVGKPGDLVLTLGVETDLEARPLGTGFTFDGPEGSVRYGAAIAFDEAGETVHVTSRLSPGGLQLTVPASFVQGATGKITIDPPITTFTVDSPPQDQTAPEVTHVSEHFRWVFTHEDKFSTVDTDIYLKQTDISGQPGPATYVELGLEEWKAPRNATMAGTKKVLIVATRDTGSAYTSIVGRVYDTPNRTLGPVLEIGTTGSGTFRYTNARPDVGGGVASNDGDRPFIVVWERTFASGDVAPRMRPVYGDSTMDPVVSLDSWSGFLNQEVVINKGGTTPEVWNIAYRRTDRATGAISLRTLQLGRAGNVIAGPNTVTHLPQGSNPTSLDVTNAVAIDDLPETYIITYDDFAPGNSDVDAIVCVDAISWRRVDINAAEHALLGRNQNHPRVIAEWRSFAIVYYEPVATGWQAYYSTLGMTDDFQLGVYERRKRVGQPTTFVGSPPAISSTVPYTAIGNTIQIAIMALAQWNDAGSNFDIVAGYWSTWGYQTRGHQFCDGAVHSRGDRSFITMGHGNDPTTDKIIVGWGLPPLKFSMVLVGTEIAHVPMVGGGPGTLCLGGNLGRFTSDLQGSNGDGYVLLHVDPTALPFASGVQSALSGQTYHWQLWHRDTAAAGGSNFSNGFSITFD